MKKKNFILLPVVCLLMAINFVSCDKDDDKGLSGNNSSVVSASDLAGVWKGVPDTWGGDDEIVAVFNGNQCMIGIADSPYDYRGQWSCSYSISNNKITITVKQEIFADGNNGCVIKYFVYKDNKLVAYTDSGELCELEKFISSNP